MIKFRTSVKFDQPATVILLDKNQIKNKKYPFTNKELANQINALSHAEQFSAEYGQIFPLQLNKKIIILVGVGCPEKLSLTCVRISVRKALQSPFLTKIKSLELIVNDQKDSVIVAAIEGVLIGTYAWRKYKSPGKDKAVIKKEVFIISASKKIYEEAVMICAGTNLTRDLINDNADVVTSEYFEKIVRELIKGKKNISVEILNKKEIEQKGLGLHLAVNQGSKKEPKLIIVKYNGAGKGKYTALIGKGMTFDTGGLNLKPTGSIETMRSDMSGAAAVVGTLKNTIVLDLKKNILFVLGIAENLTGSASYKPGDVFKSYNGKTVEIANTDAEGRLVLADAISYTVRNYKPERIIDIATLTGACVVALAHDYTGLVTTDDDFARQLVRISNDTDDRIWRLPIYPELKEAVKSNVADIRNLGYPKGAGGTITAAEFLRQFTEGTTWAHLDIAGTAFVDGQCRWYYGYGATGAGVRLLTNYLKNN